MTLVNITIWFAVFCAVYLIYQGVAKYRRNNIVADMDATEASIAEANSGFVVINNAASASPEQIVVRVAEPVTVKPRVRRKAVSEAVKSEPQANSDYSSTTSYAPFSDTTLMNTVIIGSVLASTYDTPAEVVSSPSSSDDSSSSSSSSYDSSPSYDSGSSSSFDSGSSTTDSGGGGGW